MELTDLFDDDELAFLGEVEAFLDGWDLGPRQYFEGRGGRTRELYRALGARGWLSMSWPVADGGGGRSIVYDYLLWNTLAYYRAARPDLGPGIVAHVISGHGTAEQRDRFLPSLRDGSACFCLGYSEPEAGSDLSGLRTRAVNHGDHYRINGEKCWTSDAHHADYLWLLCRTGPTESRAGGLTLLVVPMDEPGITVTPIETIDGHRLNQVFLDDVEVPVANRIGAEDGAWSIIRAALAVERHLQMLPGRLRRDLRDLVDLVGPAPAGSAAAERLDELAARVAQVEASSLATVAEMLAGRPAVAEAARTKYLGSVLAQDIPRAAMDLAGIESLAGGSPLPFLWTQSIMETIAGGSTEVMLSILAQDQWGLVSHR